MNIVVNEQLVNRRAKLGRIASLAGLAILAGGMVASFQEKLLYLSFAALILGSSSARSAATTPFAGAASPAPTSYSSKR